MDAGGGPFGWPISPRLSLDQVRSAGRTAVYTWFGESLIYCDGSVHVVPHMPRLEDIAEALRRPDVYCVDGDVGVEFGWRHLPGCDCAHCDGHRSKTQGSEQE